LNVRYRDRAKERLIGQETDANMELEGEKDLDFTKPIFEEKEK
jgi:hypothetical protein